jgi:uncharacterized membrane protein (DUF485 family)
MAMKREIKKIDPSSLARAMAYVYGSIGILYSAFILLFSLFSPSLIGFAAGLSVVVIIFMAIAGFISGMVFAFVYNFGAKKWGGIKIEV